MSFTRFNGRLFSSIVSISGKSLSGRASITIGGKTIILEAPTMFISGGYADPESSCLMGPGDQQYKVYVQSDGNGGYNLFLDSGLTTPLPPGLYFSFDTSNIGGGPSPQFIEIGGGARVLSIGRCR